jgi:hypothetical protein
MHKTGAHRLIAVSAAAAFVTEDPDKPWIVKQTLPRIFARVFADVRRMERVVRDSDLDWTLVRATLLVNDPGKGEYRVRADFPPPGGGKIARADVAHFIGIALTSGSYIRESPASPTDSRHRPGSVSGPQRAHPLAHRRQHGRAGRALRPEGHQDNHPGASRPSTRRHPRLPDPAGHPVPGPASTRRKWPWPASSSTTTTTGSLLPSDTTAPTSPTVASYLRA